MESDIERITMTKRTLLTIGVVLAVLISAAIAVLGSMNTPGVITVRISEADLQQKLSAQLPKAYKNFTLTDAKVHLADNEAKIALALDGRAFGQSFALEAGAQGRPDYKQENGSFYFQPSKIAVTKLALTGESATEKIRKFGDKYISDPAIQEKIKKSLPGIERFVEDNLESHVLASFGKMPLYTLKNDAKGLLIRASLASMVVEEGTLVLHFSIFLLTTTVLIALGAFVLSLGLAFVLVRTGTIGFLM